MRWECSVVADLLRWLSDRNLDWFKADRQRTHALYMEVLSILSMRSSQPKSTGLAFTYSRQASS